MAPVLAAEGRFPVELATSSLAVLAGAECSWMQLCGHPSFVREPAVASTNPSLVQDMSPSSHKHRFIEFAGPGASRMNLVYFRDHGFLKAGSVLDAARSNKQRKDADRPGRFSSSDLTRLRSSGSHGQEEEWHPGGNSGIAYSFCCPLADAPLYIRTLLQPKTLSTQRNLLILKYQLAAVNGRQRASSCLFTLLHWGKVAMSICLAIAGLSIAGLKPIHDHPAEELAE